MVKPHTDEARKDLSDIRLELEAMRSIQSSAELLSSRADVDAAFYKNICVKNREYITRGMNLERRILELYPELG